MKVLVTGFEPFGGESTNPSWEAVRELATRWVSEPHDAGLVVAELPVTFAGVGETLRTLLAEHRPGVVVCTGLAAGTDTIRLERVAVNVADARIPDNDGAQPVDGPVVAGGPVGHLSTLPLKASLAALQGAGIPASISNTAGTYVCNATFYALQDALSSREVRSGFVHLPRPDVIDTPTAARALDVVVRTALDHAAGRVTEPRVPAGTEH